MDLSRKRISRFCGLCLIIGLPLLGDNVRLEAAAPPDTDDDPFSFQYQARDPFAPEFQFKNGPGTKEPSPPVKGKLGPIARALAERIQFQVKVDPPQVQPGKVFRLIITGKPKAGYHTYPLTERTEQQKPTQLSSLKLVVGKDLVPLWPIKETKAEFASEATKEILLEHSKEFTWEQEILVRPVTTPGPQKVEVKIRLMVCDASGCLGPADFQPLEATILIRGETVALTPELQKRLAEPRPPVKVIKADVTALPPGASKKGGDSLIDPSKGLWGLLGAAFSFAFLMLLTPCVFPMIPITVNFFLKQSEKEHHRPLAMASVYSGTIIVLLTVVMLAMGKVVLDWANDPWFNLGLGLVLIFFALSLFGMYEIELPSALARFTSAREGQGGFVGAVFMALTFTITSFTCTGPFLGAMMAPVAGLQPPREHLVLAALVYSATFAAPFFFLALFPSMLKKLPKSGGWLNSIKVTMGFLEVGAALKFLSNTDMAWYPGNPRLFNYDTVLCAWIALSLASGLYLFGLFRLPHDDKVESIGVMRMMFASLFIGMAIYMIPALLGGKPQGIVGDNLVAFLPLKTSPGGQRGEAGHSNLAWHKDYPEAWQEAKQENKLIFMDFTGVNCTNCRANEENVFTKARVKELLKKYARVQLYTDSVPNPKLSYSEAKTQAERNFQWQMDLVNGLTNPYYVIFQPDPNSTLEGGKLKGQVIDKRDGLINDVDDFIHFLEGPLKKQVAQRSP